MMKESPCVNCQRVKDPRQCENKDCKMWRTWFVARWDYVRKCYRKDVDPCQGCGCPQELCFEPCIAKIQWIERGKCL